MVNKLPIFITRDLVIFPKQKIQLEVGRDVSIATINEAISKYDSKILITSQIDSEIDEITDNFFEHGIYAQVESFEVKPKNDEIMILKIKSISRVEFKQIKASKDGIYTAEYNILQDENLENPKNIELLENLNSLILEDQIIQIKDSDKQNLQDTLASASLSQYIDFLASIIPIEYTIKIQIQREADVSERIRVLNDVLKVKKQKIENSLSKNFNDSSKTQNEINEKVRSKLSKQQREFYLREQLKIIKEELDEISGEESEFDSMRKKVMDNPYPEHIRAKILSELKRLEAMPAANAESNVIRNYIEWLLDLPYWQESEEIIDIKIARQILDEDHFGLEKPKERILEFLAQKQKNKEAKPTVITFIGPPGVGKTSLSKSIARALNREFAKISLGGVKDESEIRGHRKTYIASAPGKIVQTMKKVGVNNPVILLDEIDKMASDMRGDPASAMLEVLDYEQNSNFQDHYIEEDYDISNVMFIATANNIEDIPSALYDRMEIINLSSYTELEKVEIAKNYLIPRAIKETNIAKKNFKWTNANILYLIRHYTIEAGVRQLYRTFLTIARKIVLLELEKSEKLENFKIGNETINDLLGKERFHYTDRSEKPEVGVVTGLAWTSYGGDILPIEVTLFDGKGDLILTGQQRDVMKESANIALGFLKSNYSKFGIPEEVMVNGKPRKIFEEHNIHVHVPDGATPKDGPSAGITFTTALVSALSGKAVSNLVGMTGEITLHGHVFPIGGLREKSISAYRSGLKKILIPEKNIKDLEDIPTEVKSKLEIVPVKEYEQVFDIVFNDKKQK